MSNQFERRAANRDPDDALSPDILAVLVVCGAEIRESDVRADLSVAVQHWLAFANAPTRPATVRILRDPARSSVPRTRSNGTHHERHRGGLTPKRSKGFAKVVASLLMGLGALVCASAGAQGPLEGEFAAESDSIPSG